MDPILSVHIPKTAGTSLLHSYAHIAGADHILLDYELRTFRATERLGTGRENALRRVARAGLRRLGLGGVASRVGSRLRRREAEPDDMVGVEIVHGHLRIRNYLDRFPDSPRVVVFREPLERMWSNYLHWSRMPEGIPTNPWFTSDMTFEQFAFFDGIRNHQADYVQPLTVDDFDVVGVTQRLDLFLTQFAEMASRHLGRAIEAPDFRVNVTKNGSMPDLGDEFRRQFERFHDADYALYRDALRRALGWDDRSPAG